MDHRLVTGYCRHYTRQQPGRYCSSAISMYLIQIAGYSSVVANFFSEMRIILLVVQPVLASCVIGDASKLESIVDQAMEYEKKCAWREAADSYAKALGILPKNDLSHIGNVYERLGQALFQSALQAENNSRFKTECAEAVENYKKAKSFFTEANCARNAPRILRCSAIIAYLDFWRAECASERKRLADEAYVLVKESLRGFLEAGEAWEYGESFNQLSIIAGFACALEQDYQIKERKTKEAVECGERTITFLTGCGDQCELARAYVETAVFLGWLGHYFLEPQEREACNQKASGYLEKAMKLSEGNALLQLLGCVPLSPLEFWGIGTDRTIDNLGKSLEYAERTRNRFLIGCAFDWLAFNSFWKTMATEDSAEMLKITKKALQFADKAKAQYSVLNFVSPRGYSFCIETAYADYCLESATLETDLTRRRDLLEKAVNAARDGLKRAEGSGYPETIRSARHALGRVLTSLAHVETDLQTKKMLLEEALRHRNDVRRLTEQTTPFHYWDLGFMLKHLVDTKLEVAELAEDPEARKRLLQEAVLDKETSVALATRYVAFFEKAGSLPLVVRVGHWQREYGDLLSRLYECTNNEECLKKAVPAYGGAAGRFQKHALMSRAAECFWKAAQTYDKLGEHLKAADSFDDASDGFQGAAERIPQLAGFYRDNGSYMQAWSEIERAKHCHQRQEYGMARRHFEKAAGLHKALTEWRYLTQNYLAWAKIERAEELSRKERCGEAIRAFGQAATLFRETEKSVQKKLGKIEKEDEKQMAKDLLKVSVLRHEYCVARVSIERAKLLDKKGEHYASAREYGSVVEVFEAIAEALEPEEDAGELRFVAALSRAWEKMMLAEHRDMPILYAESACLFEKAGEKATNDTARFLALGHSRFCRALEAGTRFLDTQEMTMYLTAMQCLQSAARYYKKAGLKTDAENTKATELLFEGYVHVNNAKREVDPEKRARLYRMTEVILQESSERYGRAKRPEKKNQVLNVLRTVKEEREWALSCAQVLRTSPLVSAAYFQAPTPTSERAVGLNIFENANIQAYLSAPKETVVGNELDIRLDLINVAKSFGLLVRIENLIPPGLKIVASDSRLSIEDGSLDLMGKRLEPLKVDSVKINVQAIEPGIITLDPKVVFVDDAGKFKTCRPKPVRLTVKPRPSFEFRVKFAEAIFDFLVSSYFEDNEKNMPLDRCGWRSLADVMKNGRVPRSSVYKIGGGRGIAIAELEKRGLIEAKVISGERGRGGNILKLRICYEKEEVKRFAHQQRFFRKKE